jgi:hypothetical protein
MKTNLGMIIEAKLPLVQVQDLYATPPVRWMEVAQLQPVPPAGDFCPVTPQEAGR